MSIPEWVLLRLMQHLVVGILTLNVVHSQAASFLMCFKADSIIWSNLLSFLLINGADEALLIEIETFICAR